MEAFMKFITLVTFSYFSITYFGQWLQEQMIVIFGLSMTLAGYYLMFLILRGTLRWIGRQLNYGKYNG